MKKDAKHRPITLELIELLKDEKLKEMMDDSIALARKANPNTDSNPIFQTEDLFSFIDRLDGCMPWLICPSKEYSSLYMRLDQGMGFMYFFFDQPLKQLEDKGYFHNSLIYHEPIAGWFRKLVKQMGLFLDSEASWNEEYYQIALANEEFGLKEDLYEDKENWKSFNDFFVRRFRHPSGRPIGSPDDPAVIVSPADASCQGLWRIDENGIVELKGDESQNGIAIKTGTL
ncbi:MAG: phosphatidylserine decarboxylase, partial [Erysipelotrichaceae bacterium]|nr:phosphatidylserine decarboxylase [Erysipelotrichaceae bacterium]